VLVPRACSVAGYAAYVGFFLMVRGIVATLEQAGPPAERSKPADKGDVPPY